MPRLRSFLLLAAAVLQFTGGFFPRWLGITGTVGGVVEPIRTPVVPAGWAFAIWGILFFLAFVFVAFHWHRRNDPTVARTGWLILAAYVGNALFVWYQPTFGPGPVSFLILETVLVFAFAAALSSREGEQSGAFRRTAYAGLFALAGWASVATPAGLSLAFRMADVPPVGGDVLAESIILLVVFTLIAPFAARLMARWAYALPIVWGLFGVAMANQTPTFFALPAASGALVLLSTWNAKRRASSS